MPLFLTFSGTCAIVSSSSKGLWHPVMHGILSFDITMFLRHMFSGPLCRYEKMRKDESFPKFADIHMPFVVCMQH